MMNETFPVKHPAQTEPRTQRRLVIYSSKSKVPVGQSEFCSHNAIMEPEKAFQASYGNRTGDTSPEALQRKEP